MTPLASTTFTGGVDETLASIDVCLSEGDGIVNGTSVLDLLNGAAAKLGISIPTVSLKSPSAIKASILGQVKLGVMSSDVVQAAKSTAADAMGAVKSATSEMQSQLTAAAGDIQNTISVNVGGIVTQVSDVKLADAQALGSVAQGLSGLDNITIKDTGSLSALAGNVMGKAADLGVTGIISGISLNPANLPIMGDALKIATPSIIKSGNLGIFSEVAANPSLAQVFKSVSPNGANAFMQSFKAIQDPKSVSTFSGLKNQFTSLKSAVKAVQGDFLKTKNTLSVKNLKNASKALKGALVATASKQAIEVGKELLGSAILTIGENIKTAKAAQDEQFAVATLAAIDTTRTANIDNQEIKDIEALVMPKVTDAHDVFPSDAHDVFPSDAQNEFPTVQSTHSLLDQYADFA